MGFRIKNWHEFQHYSHRRPPWVKLYRTLLDDSEWFALDGDASKTLVMCWLIASENDGNLPASDKLAFRLRMSIKDIEFQISKLSHWIESDASTVLADCLRDATPETERETEREKDTSLRSDDVPHETKKEAIQEKYVFESGVIRLNKKDFEKWEGAFSNLDLKAELLSLAQWAGEQEKWFFAVAGALAKRNREQKLRIESAKNGGNAEKSDFSDPEWRHRHRLDGII